MTGKADQQVRYWPTAKLLASVPEHQPAPHEPRVVTTANSNVRATRVRNLSTARPQPHAQHGAIPADSRTREADSVHTFHTRVQKRGPTSYISPLRDMGMAPDAVVAVEGTQLNTEGQNMTVKARAPGALAANPHPESTESGRKGPSSHVPVEHELRAAYETSKQLAEQLEIANLYELRLYAIAIREGVFVELLRLAGVEEAVET